MKVDCRSSNPAIVEAYGEVSDLEGYFCNVRYKGSASAASDNLYHKNTPKSVSISVHVSSSTQNVAKYTESKLTSFDVKLNSRIYVERECVNGVSLNKDTRSRVIRIVSLSDFQIHSPFKETELKVKKSREHLDSNHYNLTISVPSSQNIALNDNLVLRSVGTDS